MSTPWFTSIGVGVNQNIVYCHNGTDEGRFSFVNSQGVNIPGTWSNDEPGVVAAKLRALASAIEHYAAKYSGEEEPHGLA